MQGEGIIRSIKREHNSSDTFRRFKTRAKNLAREKIRGETSVDRSRRIEFLSKFDRIDDHFTRSNDLYLFFFFSFFMNQWTEIRFFILESNERQRVFNNPRGDFAVAKKTERKRERKRECVQEREREREKEREHAVYIFVARSLRRRDLPRFNVTSNKNVV